MASRVSSEEVGQHLVAAHVERAQVDLAPAEPRQQLRVHRELLLLGREVAAHDERELAAVQADAVGAQIGGQIHVAEQVHVGQDADAGAVERPGDRLPRHLPLRLLQDRPLVVEDLQGRLIRIDLHDAAVPVQQQGRPLGDGHHALVAHDDQRQHQRTGQDRQVRAGAAGDQHHARGPEGGELQQVRWIELARHDDAARPRIDRGALADDVAEQAHHHVLDVLHLVLDVGAFAGSEALQVKGGHLQHGARRAVAPLDAGQHPAGELRVLEDQQVRGEDQRRDVGQLVLHLGLQLLELALGGQDRGFEVGPAVHARVRALGERLVDPLAVEQRGRTHRLSFGGGLPGEPLPASRPLRARSAGRTALPVAPRRLARALGIHQQPRVLQRVGELTGDRPQRQRVVLVERRGRVALHRQHADGGDAARDRHRQERLVVLLRDAGDRLEAGVLGGDPLHDRPPAFERRADDPLAHRQPHAADRRGLQPDGGAQHQLLGLLLVDVDAAHRRPHAAGDHLHRPVQEGPQAHRAQEQPAHLPEVADQPQVIH